MSAIISKVEKKLCKYFGREYCVLTGRAASAIYLALKVIPKQSGKVVLPAIHCPSPASVSLYAGFEPIFADVDLKDFNMSVASFETILETHADIAAVIPVHLFGFACDMDSILKLAKKKNITVIEDAAQAMGAEYKGRKVGSFGEMSVVSFGHTKTLDVGWGGAVLTDDEAFYKSLLAEEAKLPECPDNIEAMYTEYRKDYYACKAKADKDEKENALFVSFPKQYRDMYLFKCAPEYAEKIDAALPKLDSLIRMRREHSTLYAKRLQNIKITVPTYAEPGVPWRFSFLVNNDKQKALTEKLHAEGLDASNWYPPLYKWYESGLKQPAGFFSNSDFLDKHIINLWVDSRANQAYISKVCDVVLDALKE